MESSCTAFLGDELVATGPIGPVLRAVKARVDGGERVVPLILDDATGRAIDVDLRGTADEVVARAEPPPSPPPGPGRPKLGVVSREVSLLPRHWEWLQAQPSGASAAIRRLVDEARKRDPEGEQARAATEATHRAMTTLAGDRPGYEEALRALFARDRERFEALTEPWPPGVRDYVRRLAFP